MLKSPNMNKKERMVLAKELGISEVKIYKWFYDHKMKLSNSQPL